MKKGVILVSFAAFAAILIASCQKEQFSQDDRDPLAPAPGFFSLKAASQTSKASISGYLLHWSRYDTLIVFDRSNQGIIFSTTENNVESATFSTSSWSGEVPTYATSYNPDYAEPYVRTMPSEGVVTLKFRAAQRIQWTSTCARQATACVGKVEYANGEYSIPEMQNVMGFITLRVADTGIKKIVAEAVGGEAMAGWVDVDYASLAAGNADFWTPTANKTCSSRITITCSDNAMDAEGCFKPAKYYFTLLPQTYSRGIKFTSYDASNRIVGERTIGANGGITIRRSEIREINQALDDYLPRTITVDLQFYNSDDTNPLGFGSMKAEDETSAGEEYIYTYTYDDNGIQKSLDLPFVIGRGHSSGARYSYEAYTLVYPAGVRGKVLVFDKAYGWIKAPAIKGHVLSGITYEYGNGYVKQMVVKQTLDPSVTIAYTSSHSDAIATSTGPCVQTLDFYSNSLSETITATPRENTPYYLQFISAGTRVYRIKLVYSSVLPTAPDFPEDVSTFPRLEIKTHGQLPIASKDDYVYGSLFYNDQNGIYPGLTSVSEEKTARFKGRGNSTWSKPKKPYRIKLESKKSFFGLAKDKDWCLLANYTDKSLMRNLVAMEISRMMGFPWTPRMYSVELWLNGQYQGVYTLSEHKKISSGRINIVPPEDGGNEMYLEIDQGMDEAFCFYSATDSIPVMFNTPEEPTGEMFSETKAWFDNFELALHSADFPSSGYEAYIDVDSFVDHYIIQELAKNVDGRMNKGAFLTRSVGGPLRAYHEWDFDIAFGNDCNLVKINASDKDLNNGPTGWLIKNYTHGKKDQGWYPTLFRDPAFVRKVKARWNELYPQLQTIPDYIDEQASLLAGPADRNFQRWPILGVYIWPNVSWPATYEEEVAALKDFYSTRLEWLDENLNALPE